ncbi:hypothetical protein F5Y15DRAFT_422922 [Xylariaceae sp. FL0016]|nr:hypothetical protein F5Y15DRAFT_422922 [Xylariaceae sp. FL0016]
MTSSQCLPSTMAPSNPFYMNRALPTGEHSNSHAAYSTSVATSGTPESITGYQSQPRSFYQTQGNPLFLSSEYNSTDAELGSSGGGTPFVPSRADSYDSSFHQNPASDSGFVSSVDAYGYMYSQNQGHAGLPATPSSALSPPSAHHHKKHKQVSRSKKSRHHQDFSPESCASSLSAANKSKLRSASRTSKNTHHNPPASAEERKSRETHNNVEKQYRNRLNAHFESLLSALPESMQCGEGEEGGDSLDSSDRRVSKAEVLDMARRHIKALERECATLEGERDELRDSMEKLRWLFGRAEGHEGSSYLDSSRMP